MVLQVRITTKVSSKRWDLLRSGYFSSVSFKIALPLFRSSVYNVLLSLRMFYSQCLFSTASTSHEPPRIISRCSSHFCRTSTASIYIRRVLSAACRKILPQKLRARSITVIQLSLYLCKIVEVAIHHNLRN